MFKKLIIAVLTLGLFLTFSSAAISSDTPKIGLNRVETTNPNAPRLNQATPVERPSATNHKPAGSALNLQTPTRILPPDYVCDFTDYSGGNAAYFWRLTDKYGDTIMGMRFTPREGYNCTLKTASIGVYGTGIKGNPGMRVIVYDDDGFGFPGTERGYVDVAPADLPHAGVYYYSVDISSMGLVYSNGAEYHVGVSKTGALGDTLTILSDDGSVGTGRSWEYFGSYGTMLNDWGLDANFLIGVDVCCGRIPYTNCYTQDYSCGTAYFWRQPDAYGDDFFNQRFTSLGPETLKSVELAIYRPGTKPWGNPDLDVYVWGDDGTGFPDLSNEIAHVLVPWASLVFYPSYLTVDLSALNLVMQGEFHVGWSTHELAPGDTLAGLSDDGSCGTGRSSEYWGSWGTMLADWGADVNFLIKANLCKDEFSDCRTLSDFNGDAYYWRYPDRYGDIALYQLFQPKGQGCRIDKVSVRFYWRGAMQSWPLFSTNSELQIWTVGTGGLPGTKIYSKILTPADYDAIVPVGGVSTRWWATFDIQADNFRYDVPIWVGLESQAPDTLSGFFTLSDDGTTGGGRSAEGWGTGFGFMLADWGVDVDHGVQLDVCCVPVAHWVCAPGDDWPTTGLNNARTGHSGNSLGNAQCNMTLAWKYSAGQIATRVNPAIFKDTVVEYFLDRIVALDINTGAQIWQRLSDGFVIGSGCYSSPTVATVGAQNLVFTAGGNTKSFSALSLTTGATVWTRNFSAHSGHFMSYGPNVVVDIGGTLVVLYADDFGWVYAVDAATGALFPGWTVNPVKPTNTGIIRGLTVGGSLLYVGTNKGVSSDGDIFAFDVATGTQVWKLSTAGGLQGALIVPAHNYGGFEGFTNAISYDAANNAIYTASWYDEASGGVSPIEDGGVLYGINATTGAVLWVTLCPNGGSGLSYPSIDAARIIHQSWTPWTTAGHQYGPIGVNKNTGGFDWKNTSTNPYWNDFAFLEGVLSCEPEGAPNFFVGQYRSNYVKWFNADNGQQLFHRRWSAVYLNALYRSGHATAPAMDDGHLILVWRNKMVCLTNQTDRPRLDIPNYTINVPVEFGSPNHTLVTFPAAISNSGCAPLTIESIVLDETTNNSSPLLARINPIDENRAVRLSGLADRFNPKTDAFLAGFDEGTGITVASKGVSSASAAYAPPAYINSIVSPAPLTTVNPGDTIPIVLDVNAPIISRGLHVFYARVTTDDPDYFLDSARIMYPNDFMIPQITLGLIGGCLYNAQRMTFGVGGANIEAVWNSSMLAEGDSSLSMKVGADQASFWQGSVLFSTSRYRVALHSDNWQGQAWEWKSTLSDPNCYNQACAPTLQSNVLLGSISNDNGATYSPVNGNIMNVAYVDSAQNMGTYDTLGNLTRWQWNYPGVVGEPPYGSYPFGVLPDTLSMGFKTCTKVIGALDVPALANFTIHKMSVYSRSGNTITDLYIGAFIDYDVAPNNKNQTTGYDALHSLGFVYDCFAPTTGWGAVKIPFGCGYEPMKNAKTCAAAQAAWNDSSIWLDSVYYWMKNLTGLSHQPGTFPCATDADDREAFWTYGKMSPTGTEPSVMGVAYFGMPGITGANDPATYFTLANTANKWCGFGRGDVNNDGKTDLVDIVYLANYVTFGGNGPFPFLHLGDVNNDGNVDALDVTYLKDFYFNFGPCPLGAWTL